MPDCYRCGERPGHITCTVCGDLLCAPCTKRHGCDEGVQKWSWAEQAPDELPPLWPHQEYGFNEVKRLIMEQDAKRILIASPTGGGKTRIMSEITQWALGMGRRVVIYNHRKLLGTQLSNVLDSHGVEHGVMASGWRPALLRDVQIASFWTVARRVKAGRWDLHDAHIVFVDEAHGNTHPTAKKILKEHQDAGAIIIGVTATPVGLKGMYDHLVQAGTQSELRACGALVPAITFGPDEPDLEGLKPGADGEFPQVELAKRFKLSILFGRVWDIFIALNPNLYPTLLCGPGVPEARMFADEFNRHGIRAATISDKTPDAKREDILQASREGDITVVCHRFVLREGIDMPWLRHCIFATTFGAVSNYLQAGGRVLRADRENPDKTRVTIQDHGGNWWRNGSLNEDRVWNLDDTNPKISRERKKRYTAPTSKEREPICCPKCHCVISADRFRGHCPICGHEFNESRRAVIQVDGTLKELRGSIHKRKKLVANEVKIWNGLFWMAMNSRRNMTFRQLLGMYARKAEQAGISPWPPSGLIGMPDSPTDSSDWDLVVKTRCRHLARKGRRRKPSKT